MSTWTSPARVLFGHTRRTLLGMFFRQPDASFYLREIVREAKLGQGAVQRELQALHRAGILERSVRGRQVFYKANQSSPIFPELRSLIVKTVGIADVLRERLKPLAGHIRVAFIYGSMARGEDVARSDVDVLAVGRVSFAELAAALGGASEAIGREVNPTVYPADEFCRKLQSGHHFLQSVLAQKKIFLIGDESELRRLAEK